MEGHKQAKRVMKLLEEPSQFLATIQIGVTLSGFLASAFAARSMVGVVADFLIRLKIPINPQLMETIATFIITAVLSYFTLVFGELVPKRLAIIKAEELSFKAAKPLSILSKITYPFVKILTLSTNGIVRLFGIDPHKEYMEETEEEIRFMLDMGEERGDILESEKEMINNIFELNDTFVSDIMTHRMDIVAIPIHATLEETLRIVNDEKYTRFPVYEEHIDQIIGILHVKDLLRYIETGSSEQFSLKNIVRKPYYVLESTPIHQIIKEMQKNKTHIAIAIDEYGGTDGIVTMEDLLEEIVGNILDEYDDYEETDIEQMNETEFIILGTTDLEDIQELFKVDFPIEEYDTLSGFIIGTLGYIPNADERPVLEYENLTFSVLEIEGRRIKKVKVTRSI